MNKEKLNEIIDLIQDIARSAVDSIKISSLVDEEKKNKIDIIEAAADKIVDEIQKIIAVV